MVVRLYFEPLGEQHDRAAFSCGNKALDEYFRGDPIRQDVSRRVTNAFVLTPDGKFVAGFYTLSPISILSVDLPPSLQKKLPKRPIGATLISRMGRDLSLRTCPETKVIVAGAGARMRCGSWSRQRCGEVRSLC